MNALVQTKASRFAPFRVIEAQFKPIEAPSRPFVREVQSVLAHELHEFPESSTSRVLPLIIRDEMLEFYAFIFCQGEPQLTIVASIPTEVRPTVPAYIDGGFNGQRDGKSGVWGCPTLLREDEQ